MKSLLKLTVLGIALAVAGAANASEFYKGKTVTYIVSTKAGGGYDTYGRLVAKYMEKYLPGSKFLVKNMPGAGHIIGANHIYGSRPDGLTLGTFNTGLVYAQILGREGAQFDLRKMSWIGKAASDPRAFLLGKDSGFSSFEDMRNAGEPFKVAVSGVGSASYNDTRILAEALNLKIQLVPGYSGREDEMAILRGEVVGSFGSRSSYQPFVDNGSGIFAFQVGKGSETDNPPVPQGSDLAGDDRGRSLIALVQSQTELARLTAAPPGIPADRLEALRTAYRNAMEDPALLAEAKKLGIPIVPLFGEDVAAKVNAALNQSPETIALFASIMKVKVPTVTVKTELLTVAPKGKVVTFRSGDAEVKSKVSGSRTKVTIDGAEAERKKLKAGMTCTITYAPGDKNEPKSMDCEG